MRSVIEVRIYLSYLWYDICMAEEKWQFEERDLLYLIDFFMPKQADRRRMLRILREDEDILQGMIEDPALAEALQSEITPIIRVSPYLYFAVLLRQAYEDLKRKPYTFEKETHKMLVIFDTKAILDLMQKKRMMIYLARMLASFTKIRTHSVTIRVRNGTWRRIRYSDFDVECLISYCEAMDEQYLFPVYQRIADICLFTMGIYALASADEAETRSPRRRRSGHYREYGPQYYLTAANHPDAMTGEMRETLVELAESFELAIKPLAFMADHYIGSLKTKLFRLSDADH